MLLLRWLVPHRGRAAEGLIVHRILVSFARPIHVQVWNEYIHSSEHTNCLNGAQAYYSGRCPTSITSTVLRQPRCSCRSTAGMERCLRVRVPTSNAIQTSVSSSFVLGCTHSSKLQLSRIFMQFWTLRTSLYQVSYVSNYAKRFMLSFATIIVAIWHSI